MMGEVDIDTFTIDQYLMVTQGNQASGMAKAKFRGMMEKDIKDMTITEYMEYEAKIKTQSWKNARSYFQQNMKIRISTLFTMIRVRGHDYISDDKSEIGEQRMINHTDSDKTFTPKPQSADEELSSYEDLDDWLIIKTEKHMCGQDKENAEEALVAILKLLLKECKAV
nr:hypothetical protein [Tanacetum cinerariifolium]